MIRLIVALLALLAVTAAMAQTLPLLGVGPNDTTPAVACNPDGLDFTDGCGTTQLMAFM